MLCWGKGLESCNRVVTLEFQICNLRSISNDNFHYHPAAKSISTASKSLRGKMEVYQHQLSSRLAGAVMIFTCSSNAAMSDNSIYCMIPEPFPSTVFGKGSAMPDYPR